MNPPRPFAHLHCHSHYSLLDGATRIPALVARAKEHGMNAVAVTDHGNLYGAMELYTHCKANDVNPILGLEAYVAPGDRRDKTGATRMKEASFHLTLLAMNRTGFQNLIRLSSKAFLEGFYYKPRIDKELLEEFNDGIICLSGCASSELSHLILAGKTQEAEELCAWYGRVFGDRFYLEIQNAGIDIQRHCLEGTVDLAAKMGQPLVATNDAHYLRREDAGAQDILLCVNTRTTRNDDKRMRMTGDQLFVRTPEEMYAAFPDHADAVARTQEIADRVEIDLDLTTRHFPVFTPPQSVASGQWSVVSGQSSEVSTSTPHSATDSPSAATPPQSPPSEGGEAGSDSAYLRELCAAGLTERYGDAVTDEHRRRLEYELSVIDRMGYSSYFLIVWDLVRFARENGIPASARGSACGAIVAYVLGLSHVCPLKYDLLFERFLDPSRTEPPDIDIDFCRDRRQLVIDYTKQKYGAENVAQIGTFGTLKAKAAIRDVGRALGVPLPRVNEIAKMVPETLGIKLAEAIKETPDLKQAYDADPQVRELLDIAQQLEGLARSAGTHAAGVVVADQPLWRLLPLQKITGKEDIITQWDGPTVEMAGLLKMDFLGLRNLTILDQAVRNVRKHRGEDIDPNTLPLDDEATFQLLQRGETKGIFQLESGGMRDLLTKMRPDQFADIIATSALYRPGPLEGGMVMDYVDIKHGRKPVPKVHPLIDEVVEETYGILVYQEQVMRILNRMGGIELSDAYRCIKAISKKKLPLIAKYREEFVTGAQQRDLNEGTAQETFGLIEKFAGYGFNKSHSTAYGAIAYQTAYLKAHYPLEFMAALLSCGMESSDRISEHVDDARRMGIDVLPPDVNVSDVEFSVHGEKLTFGLGAIKGVGEAAVGAIVAERAANGPFRDIYELAERVDPKHLTKSVLETLVKAGALDSLGPNRAQHMLVAERAVQAAAARHRDLVRGQKNLFGDDEPGNAEVVHTLPDAPDWSHRQKLAAEKETLGFYLTSHPLTEHAERIEKYATHSTADLARIEDEGEALVGGMISAIKRSATKKPSRNGHTRYVNFDLEDTHGMIRCIIWPEEYAQFGERVEPDAICIVRGKIERRGREPNLVVDRLLTLEQAEREFTRQVAIRFQRGMHTAEDMIEVKNVLRRHPGRTEVIIVVDSAEQSDSLVRKTYTMSTPPDLRVACTPELKHDLRAVMGEDHFRFLSASRRRNGQGNGHAPP